MTDDDDDFTAFVAARWRTLVRAGLLLGCDLAEAEDLAQTTLVKCYLAWPRVAAADDRDAYVYRVLVNAHRQRRRRRWHGERPTEVLPDVPVADHGTAAGEADAVARALADLSADHREVVLLRFYLQLGETQIAEVLGVRPGTVKSRLSRALRRLSTNAHLTPLGPASEGDGAR
ncbi:SigE family RNA polymerase sigma factor [Nocardioides sp. SOB77]|uniref:SigE family RNA polymerase sigma factor n=1 Tax=Nocardioides oceani TaxID=3058369 RepID=A0ABT8FHF3_9ACTN|nr:SigE family RNA polymerase sigma factor [Nocardioides oceani]MDN4174123.1 SigE family RNA polymerase sigma factor [Nocardioides oceani]